MNQVKRIQALCLKIYWLQTKYFWKYVSFPIFIVNVERIRQEAGFVI